MNIAVVGSSGYIASYLCKRLAVQGHILLNIDKKGDKVEFLNLENADKFSYSLLDDIEFVIFTAAISGPDKCAINFELAWKVNVVGTKYFIYEALRRKCKVLFFSSDAVFGDMQGTIYTEGTETKAKTAYGRMKKAVEDEFKSNSHFKAVRLSYVTSVNDKFIAYCLKCIHENKQANVYHPFYRNCITISDVDDAVIWLINHFDEYRPFSLNLAGEELISRVRIADELNRIFDNRLRYVILQPGEEFFENRSKITQMRSLYLKEYNILKPQCFTEKIQKELEGVKL